MIEPLCSVYLHVVNVSCVVCCLLTYRWKCSMWAMRSPSYHQYLYVIFQLWFWLLCFFSDYVYHHWNILLTLWSGLHCKVSVYFGVFFHFWVTFRSLNCFWLYVVIIIEWSICWNLPPLWLYIKPTEVALCSKGHLRISSQISFLTKRERWLPFLPHHHWGTASHIL